MIKRISLLVRRPELSAEEFARHWREIHGPLAKPVPNVIRYVQNLVVGDSGHPDLPSGGQRIDGIVEFWFEDRATMEAAFATPEAEAMFADGTLFIESVTSFIVEEHTVIGDD
jgi:uncharacterized protein (TIGR02118 family)